MSLLIHPMMEDAEGQEGWEADGAKTCLSKLFLVQVALFPLYPGFLISKLMLFSNYFIITM